MNPFMQHVTLSTPEERETLAADVLFVGGGPASLSGAYHLAQLVEKHNTAIDAGGEGEKLAPMIVVIEKGAEVGAHAFSGAVLNPIALEELIPDYADRDCPIESPVTNDAFYFMTKSKAHKIPYVPGNMSNHGNVVISLAKFNRWLGGQAESLGVNVFPGFAGVQIIEEGSAVAGVRTGDKGINARGERKGNFEPGIELRSKLTLFGDGPRGYLSKQLILQRHLLKGKTPQVFETGVKEVFEMPEGRTEPGRVIHTLGYPFKRDGVGGTWMYHMGGNLISIGLVMPLDIKDPYVDQHSLFQEFKAHPFVKGYLDGGKPIQYGAKVISSGGYYSIPKLYTDGAMLIGESAAMVDMQRLKGIHLAMKSGMLAAEQAFEALKKNDFSEATLAPYEKNIYDSYIGKSLHRVRHFHKALGHGLPRAFFHLGIQHLTGGADVQSYEAVHEDYQSTEPIEKYYGSKVEEPPSPEYDGTYSLDKVSDIFISGTMHDEDQPSHLKVLDSAVCLDTCVETFKYPCNRFCPASVYEMLTDEGTNQLRLQVNFANCVHCQTCDIKCPLDNIRWTPPEGGQGPNYTIL